MGLEGSGASRRPGSIVRVLRTERWVQPTERAGSEGSFICRLRRQENRTTALAGEEMHPPLVAGATTLPGGKHVTGFAGRLQLPYESSSFATPAVRWGDKRKAP